MKNNRFESAKIDDALVGPGQEAVRAAVKALPDDTLSMSWRSALNEKLVAEAAARRRRARISWFIRPALGLGLAGTLAVLMLVRAPQPAAPRLSASGDALEAALVSTHRQSAFAWDVAGVGLSPIDVQGNADASVVSDKPDTSSPTPVNAWNEEDLDTL
jgi:hypothetical protein